MFRLLDENKNYPRLKGFFLFFSFFLITVSQSAYLEQTGLNTYIEYFGLFLLLLGCFFWNKRHGFKEIKRHFIFGFVLLLLFSAGLIVQGLLPGTKIRLLVSMVLLFVFALSGNSLFQYRSCLPVIGWSVLAGSFACFGLALIVGDSFYVQSVEGFSIGFDLSFGMQFKNLFGYTILVSCVALFLAYRHSKNAVHLFGGLLSTVLLLLSNCRGGIVLLAFFFIIGVVRFIPSLGKKGRIIFWIVLFTAVGLGMGFLFGRFSATFGYRTRGLINYLSYVQGDYFHLIFGNAEMAFSETGLSYAENVRSVIGWDGTVELVILNVLIKNGLLGLLGFGMIIFRFLSKGSLMRGTEKIEYFSIFLPFFASIFMEAYFANINMVYTVFNYSILNYYIGTYSPRKYQLRSQIFRTLKNTGLLSGVQM